MGSATTVGIRTGCCASISEWQLPSFVKRGFLKEVTLKPEFEGEHCKRPARLRRQHGTQLEGGTVRASGPACSQAGAES